MTTPAAIAGSLSETQRACLLWACSFLPLNAPTDGEGVEAFCDDAETTDTLNQCFNLGLMSQIGNADADHYYIKVEPLGIDVRAHLEKNDG